jgi:predicted kinase
MTAHNLDADLPPLVIVCGPPGAGKTVLAEELSLKTRLPVIAKDLIKETLMDHFGHGEPAGTAAFAVQLAVADAVLTAGSGLILEGAFLRDQVNVDELALKARTVILYLSAPLDCLVARYTDRQQSRHPGHRGLEALPDLRSRFTDGLYAPAGFDVPVLRVDTENGYHPSEGEIMRWLGEHGVAS